VETHRTQSLLWFGLAHTNGGVVRGTMVGSSAAPAAVPCWLVSSGESKPVCSGVSSIASYRHKAVGREHEGWSTELR
jgi:hypothetical protein